MVNAGKALFAVAFAFGLLPSGCLRPAFLTAARTKSRTDASKDKKRKAKSEARPVIQTFTCERWCNA